MRLVSITLFWLIFATLISLGVWQLQRLQWKEALLAEYAEKGQRKPLDLYEFIGRIDRKDGALFEPATVTAPPLCDKLIFVGLRQYQQVPGYHVVMPFKIHGGYLLANLGWINAKNQPAWAPSPEFCSRPQVLSGVMVQADGSNWFSDQVSGQIEGNIWRNIDSDAIAEAYNLHPMLPGVLRQTDTALAGLVPLEKKLSLPNRHLEYAGTWFAFAAVWGVIGWLRWRNHQRHSTQKLT